MKKLFTLFVMTLIAFSASAKEVVDFSSKIPYGEVKQFGNWEWIGLVLAQGEPVVSGSTADDSNVQYYDASAFDYLCVKYKEATVAFQVFLQYKCLGTVGQYGTDFDQVQVEITANTNGFVAIKLDAAKKNTINQIAFQSKGEGSIVLSEVYWASEAEYTADAAANPVTPYTPPTKELNLASATNAWNDASFVTYDTNTHTATIVKDNGASGWWVNGISADYSYLVLEIIDMQIVGYAQLQQLPGGAIPLSAGSYVKVIDISGMDLSGGFNLVVQGGAGTTWTWKAVYFATAEYVQANNIHDEVIYGDTQDVSLAGLSPWEDENKNPRATFDASTGVLTITGEDGGGAGWWQGSADFSHFDNFVVELESTTVGGNVTVEYVAEAPAAPALNRANAQTEVEFGVGATCVVVPLDATNKSAVRQMWVSGDKGATYTIKKAYMAIASATPEANIGTIDTGINEAVAAKNATAEKYNLAGQKVSDSYKGVVIVNGKKMVQK